MRPYFAILLAVLGAPGFVVTDRGPQFVVTRSPVAFVVTEHARKPVAVSLPEVQCITASWCGPCRQVKADEKARKFPFSMKFVDVDRDHPPVNVETLPLFYWVNVDGQAYQYPPPGTDVSKAGYPGPERLTEIVRNTQPRAPP